MENIKFTSITDLHPPHVAKSWLTPAKRGKIVKAIQEKRTRDAVEQAGYLKQINFLKKLNNALDELLAHS